MIFIESAIIIYLANQNNTKTNKIKQLNNDLISVTKQHSNISKHIINKQNNNNHNNNNSENKVSIEKLQKENNDLQKQFDNKDQQINNLTNELLKIHSIKSKKTYSFIDAINRIIIYDNNKFETYSYYVKTCIFQKGEYYPEKLYDGASYLIDKIFKYKDFELTIEEKLKNVIMEPTKTIFLLSIKNNPDDFIGCIMSGEKEYANEKQANECLEVIKTIVKESNQ